MTTPSILRHSKAHRAAVERNAKLEASKWETRLTLEYGSGDTKLFFDVIRANSARLVLHSVDPLHKKAYFVLAVYGTKPLVMPFGFKVVKTEKVRL